MSTATKRKKKEATCAACGSSEALYITLKNGERLPSYVMRLGVGLFCNPCAEVSR